MPARILDDYVICRTRAYYTAHPESFRPRRILDMEDSERRGKIFVNEHFIPRIRDLSKEGAYHKILKLEECDEENKVYYLVYRDLDKTIACKPDLVSIVLLHDGTLRALVFEVADTDVNIVLRRKYILPRILLYTEATYLYYGIPSVGFYVSLSPRSSPPSIILLPKGNSNRKLVRILEGVSKLVSATEAPKPSRKPMCSHCVYASICKFAM